MDDNFSPPAEENENIPPQNNDSDDDQSRKSQRPSLRDLKKLRQSNPLKGGGLNPAKMLGKGGLPGSPISGGMAKNIGGRAGMMAARGLMAFFATPPGWITLIIILIILFLIIIIYMIAGDKSSEKVSLALVKSAPEQVDNDTEIEYKLEIIYTGKPDQIVVTDELPYNADFVSAEGPGSPEYDKDRRVVTWLIDLENGEVAKADQKTNTPNYARYNGKSVSYVQTPPFLKNAGASNLKLPVIITAK